MTAKEAHKKQWESLKDKPLSAKLKYIFTYYWPGIVGGVCAIIFLVSWISGALTQKDTVLGGYLLNGMTNKAYQGNLCQEFMELRQFNTEDEDFRLVSDVFFSTTESTDSEMYIMESVVVQIATGELDFIVADSQTYPVFSAYYTDLRNVLSAEQLEQWKDLLVYVEKQDLDELTNDDIDNVAIPEYYLSAQGLKDPLPIGIRLPEDSKLFQAYTYPEGDIIFGFTLASRHLENAIAFLEYIIH